MGKKHAKKRQALRDMAYETTPAQRLMRSEIEAGMHKRQTLPEPIKASAVLDDMLGPVSEDRAVTELAYEVINEHGDGLILDLKQWPIVQRLVEAGIRRGAGQ